MKKEYVKPEMQVYDINMTQILCSSDPVWYPGQFN